MESPYKSKAHSTVWWNGYFAARDGKRRRSPYAISAHTLGGRNGNVVSGARGYHIAWLKGYDAALGLTE
jgi:hypothetical protein